MLLAGEDGWPARGFTRVLSATVTVGVAYTIYSEWLNVEIRQACAYTEAMPRLPWLGTGLGLWPATGPGEPGQPLRPLVATPSMM